MEIYWKILFDLQKSDLQILNFKNNRIIKIKQTNKQIKRPHRINQSICSQVHPLPSLSCPFSVFSKQRLQHFYWTLLGASQNLKCITELHVSRKNPEVNTVQLPWSLINPGSGLSLILNKAHHSHCFKLAALCVPGGMAGRLLLCPPQRLATARHLRLPETSA